MLKNNRFVYLGLGLFGVVLGIIVMQYNRPDWAGARIATKNTEARGGHEAWQQIRSMTLVGMLDAGKVKAETAKSNMDTMTASVSAHELALKVRSQEQSDVWKTVQLPYSLDLLRPRKSHLEIEFSGDKAIQVYDGEHGWKLRPFLGRREVEPYTPLETNAASLQQELDGYLINHQTKGTKVELEGNETVEGHDTFKLKLTLKGGEERRLWVDTKTYLEVKLDESRTVNGPPLVLSTYFHDYKPIDGLLIPHLIETRKEGGKDTEKIIINKVILNPNLEDSHFAKPALATIGYYEPENRH